jgi:hypothetical protein
MSSGEFWDLKGQQYADAWHRAAADTEEAIQELDAAAEAMEGDIRVAKADLICRDGIDAALVAALRSADPSHPLADHAVRDGIYKAGVVEFTRLYGDGSTPDWGEIAQRGLLMKLPGVPASPLADAAAAAMRGNPKG